MHQLLPIARAGRAVFLSVLLYFFASCGGRQVCHDLEGRWTNGEGQDFVFDPTGKALWLTRFGSSYDTVAFDYALNCDEQPAEIDLLNFQGGPHVGRALYGILEWNSDTSFRLHFEPGAEAGNRPTAFDPEQTLEFVRSER
jgi:hypothetical protein